jgi:hypothetical protein
MKSKCATCPFGPNGDQRLRAEVELRTMTEASQICHHPRVHGKKETHLCRGARDHQLQVFHRIGMLESATDEAWDHAVEAHPTLGPLRERLAAKAAEAASTSTGIRKRGLNRPH